MADLKISQLGSIITVVPATDVLPVVQGGTTYKITPNQILGSSGVALLASATITGNLTVDTNTLFVDSTNNRVGIGTVIPTNACQIQGTGQATITPIVTGDGSALALIDSAGGGNNGGMLVLGASVASGLIGQVAIKSLLSDGTQNGTANLAFFTRGATSDSTLSERYRIAANGVATWSNVGGVAGTAMTLNSTGLGVGVVPSSNRFQVDGNIGLPNSCTASGETSGVFSIDVANLLTLTGANWRQCSLLLVYSGVDTGLGNSTVLQTVVTLQGLSTYGTISKNDIVGTASVAVSNDTTTGARITVTVPTGNAGSVYVMLLGGAGATTRPSITINA